MDLEDKPITIAEATSNAKGGIEGLNLVDLGSSFDIKEFTGGEMERIETPALILAAGLASYQGLRKVDAMPKPIQALGAIGIGLMAGSAYEMIMSKLKE